MASEKSSISEAKHTANTAEWLRGYIDGHRSLAIPSARPPTRSNRFHYHHTCTKQQPQYTEPHHPSMEFITAASAPPPLPPPVKQYQSQAVIHLTSNNRRGSTSGEDKPGLIRSISRGSLGRRSSTGDGGESGGGLRRVLSRGEGESGGGLRRVLSRGDKSGADGSGRRSSDGNVLKHAETAPTTGAPAMQRTKSSELKNGKWISPVMAGVAGVSGPCLQTPAEI